MVRTLSALLRGVVGLAILHYAFVNDAPGIGVLASLVMYLSGYALGQWGAGERDGGA